MQEFDVIVIGSGPAGYVAAIRAAQLGLKTACIEKDSTLGGTCLNVGCIPSKCLLQSTEMFYKLTHHGKEHGILASEVRVDLNAMMQRKQKVVEGFTRGIEGLFKKNKITRFEGLGTLKSANVVSVSGKEEIKAKYIILATGSEPIELPFLPFDEKRIVSSTGILSLEKIPKKMVVIGAGIIGVELGSVYNRMGTKVEYIEFLDHICPVVDRTLSKHLQKVLEKQGMAFHLSHKVTQAETKTNEIHLKAEGPEGKILETAADVVLVCIGRKPYSEGLGLQTLKIETDKRGFVQIDGMFRTSVPNIFAVGDLVPGPMLAHKGSEEGAAVAEIIAGHRPIVEYIAIPSVAYTDPEVSGVGLTEEQAKEKNLDYITASFPFKANSRARCMGDDEGLIKILADKNTHRIIGVHIIGPHASELIAESVLAIQLKATADQVAETSHAHPTLSESMKEAAMAIANGKPIHL